MTPIDYGPAKAFLSTADTVGFPLTAAIVLVVFGLFGLRHRAVISTETLNVLGALAMAVGGPVAIVAGAAHYILAAGTGYFQVAGDFRNSQAWVDGLYWFMAIVAPLWAIAWLAGAVQFWLIRERALRVQREVPDSAQVTGRHGRKKRHRADRNGGDQTLSQG